MGIRAATADDAAAIAEVFVAAAKQSWGEEAPAMEPPPIQGGELVAEDDDGITGFAIIKDGEIDLLATHPRVRAAARAARSSSRPRRRCATRANPRSRCGPRSATPAPAASTGPPAGASDRLPRARLERGAAARAALPQAPLSDGSRLTGVGLVVLGAFTAQIGAAFAVELFDELGWRAGASGASPSPR